MGNRVWILPTIFVDHPSGEESFGVRVFDDYGSAYTNLWNRGDLDLEDLDILRKMLKDEDKEIQDILATVKDRETGIDIGENRYEWNDIQSIFYREETTEEE